MSPPPPAFTQPPPPSFDAKPSEKLRPWWGMGDVLLAPFFIGILAIVGAVLGIFLVVATGETSLDEIFTLAETGASNFDLESSVAFIVIAGLGQQLGQALWPFIVSRWKGLGMRSDWKWEFKRIDLGIGLGVAILAQIAALAVGTLTSWLVDLQDEDAAGNTEILENATDSPWLIGVLFLVVIGAPFTEELLFRGLIMRSIEKRLGLIAGVLGSTFLFAIIHINGTSLTGDGQIVLWATIAVVGLILGITAAKTDRLGPAIIAHIIFNAASTTAVLAGWA